MYCITKNTNYLYRNYLQSGQKIYKTSHYEYSTSSSGGGGGQDLQPLQINAQKNINQLDSLLQDLKHERITTLERSEKGKYIRYTYQKKKLPLKI